MFVSGRAAAATSPRRRPAPPGLCGVAVVATGHRPGGKAGRPRSRPRPGLVPASSRPRLGSASIGLVCRGQTVLPCPPPAARGGAGAGRPALPRQGKHTHTHSHLHTHTHTNVHTHMWRLAPIRAAGDETSPTPFYTPTKRSLSPHAALKPHAHTRVHAHTHTHGPLPRLSCQRFGIHTGAAALEQGRGVGSHQAPPGPTRPHQAPGAVSWEEDDFKAGRQLKSATGSKPSGKPGKA
ncbi:Hypothetical predicted protein [Olea europaea subsp. europaea]|uniref:Uncharacterized protein n=1 Tax=Olea europaea subsp. europaea TaxID=158383 RepID=A0A8S0US46_OLEEU|nr:Hypothetical predicted protein [Olea europaea subsp. europaea]